MLTKSVPFSVSTAPLAVVGLFTADWVVLAGAILVVAGLTAFNFAPSPIRALGWQPPKAPPLTGVLAPNSALADAEVLLAGELSGPEDLAISADGGTLYASSFCDGRIVRINVSPGVTPAAVDHAHTGGSPVDLALRTDGTMLVCDSDKGLLLIDASGTVTTLLPLGTTVDGRPFVRPDGVSETGNATC